MSIDNVHDTLKEHLPENKFKEVYKLLYGDEIENIELNKDSIELAKKYLFQIKFFNITAKPEQLRSRREVIVAVVQNNISVSTSSSIELQRNGIYKKVEKFVEAAYLNNVNIICFQETWAMPFAFCTREKLPWTEFAESAESGPTTLFCIQLAKKYHLVILSPILERDEKHGDIIWNTCVVISETGSIIGKTRKNHIPRVGDFNESTYYMESNLGHPVFETKYGKIAINICYGRHHPLNWLMYGLNNAEIVFNPNATVSGLSETLWPIEARCAAVANSYYVFATNRVGTETFPNEFTSGDGKPSHKSFGHFYGSAYATAPSGLRTPEMSRFKEGVLIVKIDLNLCRQVKDEWGFSFTRRLDFYAKELTKASKTDYEPNIIKD